MKISQGLTAGQHRTMFANRQAEGGQRVEHASMCRRHFPACDITQAVGEELERAAGRHRRIKLPDTPCGRIARIDQRLVATGGGLRVVLRQIVATHVHLATHFQHRRRIATQAQGNLPDGAQILRHVLSGRAIAAGGAAHQDTPFVAQADCQTVEFQFSGVFNRGGIRRQVQLTSDTGIEIKGAAGIGIGFGLDRQHRHHMGNRHKLGQCLPTHPLCR